MVKKWKKNAADGGINRGLTHIVAAAAVDFLKSKCYKEKII